MLLTEAITIGIVTGFVGVLINFMLRGIGKDLDLTCSPQKIFGVFFLTGALIHTAFELGGLNKWYCENGVACKKIRA